MTGYTLVVGGAGYIGTHVVEAGERVIILDNLDNSSEVAIERVREITQCKPADLLFEKVDLLDFKALMGVLAKYVTENDKDLSPFCACIHLAGLKAVGESVSLPLFYYQNNVTGTFNLLRALEKFGCYNFVFSSSACVYGDPDKVPITETAEIRPENPYGESKVIIERVLKSVTGCNKKWRIISLRYFNPIGAHKSGKIGEDPQGQPNNLLPFVAQVAVGVRPKLYIFGNDYETCDGTGVRDYIHITDLAKGHIAALGKVKETDVSFDVYNLGTGQGVSVLEVVSSFEKASGKKIEYEIVGRRPGDSGTVYADASKAKEILGWEASLGIDDMCKDTWKWQKNNPFGYRTEAEKSSETERKGLVFDLYT